MTVDTVSWPLLIGVPLLVLWQIFLDQTLSWVIALLNKRSCSPRETEIREEIRSLKKTQDGISMMDEFAKHAKIERRLIKLKAALQELQSDRISQTKMSYRAFQITFYAITGLLFLFIFFTYGSEPVVIFNESHPFYPFHLLMSYPTGLSGAIGIPFWTLICRSAIPCLFKTKS
ncbi:hypothetical protein TCAL_00094 [Tigriopus californicus]|uniref:Guided entry of tail-anchored proteins factor 1 n=1 Tax=Tigriopus californicus TaxID=6832 RepID=A0A553PFS6_TIGCA|nr:guided entry of tail-anchored proteins factor 1-like [Tigriopus californicus]TRY76538.1 hypothetical protein TCAL_00094 [Tigriopus californicus]|eukprot:TCALIF_00094-PA protein Name:"Similar to wrb Tail-anchored protein insertion receptor WRB (Danio rerio)" AED:0.02 eAED:0.02 QI:81/1/1/1/0.66/0.75/4/116/173